MVLFAITSDITISETTQLHFKAIQLLWFHVMWMPNEKAKIMLRRELDKDKPKIINKILLD